MVKSILNFLNESSLSRIWNQTRKHDFGAITAFRYAEDCGSGRKYSKKENLQRNKSLLAKLRAKGYGVTSIKGSYIENYGSSNAKEVGENSFLVIDLQDKKSLRKDLLALGKEFEQDSIIFGKANGDAILIGTNKCKDGYPGYRKEVKQGGAIFGKSGEFLSRVKGRPFIFSEDVKIKEPAVSKYPTELHGWVILSEKHWSELEV